jgi:hypothetical protein
LGDKVPDQIFQPQNQKANRDDAKQGSRNYGQYRNFNTGKQYKYSNADYNSARSLVDGIIGHKPTYAHRADNNTRADSERQFPCGEAAGDKYDAAHKAPYRVIAKSVHDFC